MKRSKDINIKIILMSLKYVHVSVHFERVTKISAIY